MLAREFNETEMLVWLVRRCGWDSQSLRALQSAFAGMSDEKFYSLVAELEKAEGIYGVSVVTTKILS